MIKFSTLMFHQAFDSHLNMILGNVEEIVTTLEIDEETFEEVYKVNSIAMIIIKLVCYNLTIFNFVF